MSEASTQGRIERPGEHVTVDGDHVGDIVAGKVTVARGGSLKGEVDAPEVIVEGSLEGKVRAEILTQIAGGTMSGEFAVTMARLAGHAKGLVIAETALVKRTSRIEGYVLADSWGVEPGACVRATVFSEPGVSTRSDLLDTARTGLARAKARADGIPAQAVPAQPEPEEPAPVREVEEPVDVTPLRSFVRPAAPSPRVEDDLEREIRETLMPSRAAAASVASHPATMVRPSQAPVASAPVAPKPAAPQAAAISRFFRADDMRSATGPRIL